MVKDRLNIGQVSTQLENRVIKQRQVYNKKEKRIVPRIHTIILTLKDGHFYKIKPFP